VLALGGGLTPAPAQEVRTKFVRRAAWDIGYNLLTMLGRPIFPRFRRHRPNHVLVEYAGWLRRIFKRRSLDRHAAGEVERVCASPNGFFLVPLQLDTDYQIRVHSRFADNAEFLDEVMASFAAHAPPEVELVIKLHPLDNGLVDRRAQVEKIARQHDLSDRVTFIDGGWLPALLTGARGIVVVNSTVGTTSLEVGRPTIALGRAIYNIPGLTFQDGLDRFWTEGTPPQADLFAAFRELVMQRTQVNGGFFDPDSIRLAVVGAADRVEAVPPLLQFFDEPARDHANPAELYPGAQPAE
jgi:capsular polysaccharide export protein